MSELAVVVLAHRDPEQLAHLLEALDPLPVVVHVDARVAPAEAAELLAVARRRPGAVLAPRRRTHLASWSLVAAELDALALAVGRTDAEHVVVMSGADYPLLPVPVLEAELRARPGTRLENVPLPHPGWSTPHYQDGGLWRLEHRFLTHRDRVLHLGEVPLHWPWRRPLPAGVELRGGSAWKVISREDAERLLHVVRTRPDLVRRWRTTLVPEETFVMSVLASPALTGGAALAPQALGSWFMHWPEGEHHPCWLTERDLPALDAERAERERAGQPPLLFARKLSSDASGGFRRAVDAQRSHAPW